MWGKQTPLQTLQTAEAQCFILHRTGGRRATAEITMAQCHLPFVTLCLNYNKSLFVRTQQWLWQNIWANQWRGQYEFNLQESLLHWRAWFSLSLWLSSHPVLSFLPLLFGGARPGKAPKLQAGGGIVADVVGVEHGSWAEDIHFLHHLLSFLFGAFAFATLGFATFNRLQRGNDHKNTQLVLCLYGLASG